MTKSSKLIVKAISAPEMMPGRIWGTMTRRSAVNGGAPRAIAASIRLGSRERSLGVTESIT